MRRAAAYIRVSTDDQTEFSPESQIEKIRIYAEKNQLCLEKKFIFADEGISGRTARKRPAFNKMIALAKQKPKPFDVILVWKFSRFARNREDSIVYKSMLRKELGIDVISVSEDIGDDKMSVLFEAMIEAMDEYYSLNLAEEVKRGMTQKAKKGGILSAPAFGYKIENDKYVIVPDEAEIIRKVFNDYISGSGFLKIAKELNSMGVKTRRGNKIESRTVEYWLNNPVYTGKIRWNPNGAMCRNYNLNTAIISAGAHMPIIDDAIWNKAQEKMNIQKEKYRKYRIYERGDLSHWLTGIVRCEICGGVLSNQGGYFGCSNRSRGMCSGNGYISAKKLGNIVINALSDIMAQNVVFKFKSSYYNAIRYNKNFNIITANIQKLKGQLERVKLAYEDGIDTLSEYKAEKKKILDEINNLKDTIYNEEKNQKSMESDKEVKRLTDILKDDTISNVIKNKAIRMIFKEIIKGGEDGKTLKLVFWE